MTQPYNSEKINKLSVQTLFTYQVFHRGPYDANRPAAGERHPRNNQNVTIRS